MAFGLLSGIAKRSEDSGVAQVPESRLRCVRLALTSGHRSPLDNLPEVL